MSVAVGLNFARVCFPRNRVHPGRGNSFDDHLLRYGARVSRDRHSTVQHVEGEPVLAADHTAGNQRRYGRLHLDRLAFIRHSRELGFPLDAIRELLSLTDNPERSCEAADRIARRQLEQVKTRILRLKALKAELERMIVQCRGGRIANCRVIEALASHASG